MATLICLIIAYFFGPSATSFVIALTIGCVIDHFSRGDIINLIQNVCAVIFIAPVLYKIISPSAEFLSFVGWGIISAIILVFAGMLVNIVVGLFFVRKDTTK